MLKLAGENENTLERIEIISYNPASQDTGDLEASTSTITATAEASGTVNADYSDALTLAMPGDSRLEVKSICARLLVTVDSITAGHLYCRVYVDAQDTDHRLLDCDFTGTGDQVNHTNKTSGTLFTLLTDGEAHTLYFFFWVDADSAVISQVKLREAVGCDGTAETEIMRLNHTGLVLLNFYSERWGSGTPKVRYRVAPGNLWSTVIFEQNVANTFSKIYQPALIHDYLKISMEGSVATDICYFPEIVAILRSEQ